MLILSFTGGKHVTIVCNVIKKLGLQKLKKMWKQITRDKLLWMLLPFFFPWHILQDTFYAYNIIKYTIKESGRRQRATARENTKRHDEREKAVVDTAALHQTDDISRRCLRYVSCRAQTWGPFDIFYRAVRFSLDRYKNSIATPSEERVYYRRLSSPRWKLANFQVSAETNNLLGLGFLSGVFSSLGVVFFFLFLLIRA